MVKPTRRPAPRRPDGKGFAGPPEKLADAADPPLLPEGFPPEAALTTIDRAVDAYWATKEYAWELSRRYDEYLQSREGKERDQAVEFAWQLWSDAAGSAHTDAERHLLAIIYALGPGAEWVGPRRAVHAARPARALVHRDRVYLAICDEDARSDAEYRALMGVPQPEDRDQAYMSVVVMELGHFAVAVGDAGIIPLPEVLNVQR